MNLESKFFGSLSCKAFKGWTQILHFKLVKKNGIKLRPIYIYPLGNDHISRLAKRKIVFKSAVVGDM